MTVCCTLYELHEVMICLELATSEKKKSVWSTRSPLWKFW